MSTTSLNKSPFDIALSRVNNDGWIEVTYAELEWFAEQYRSHLYNRPGVVSMPFNEFCTPQDLENWRQLIAWWPRVAPRGATAPFLPLLSLLLDSQHGAPTLPPIHFSAALRAHWERAVAWCNAHNISCDNPNETYEQRSKRLNRERVAKWREAKKAEADPALADAVVTAKQAKARAVEDAKAHFGPLIEAANAKVKEAYDWFIAQSRERKALQEQLKAAIAAAKGDHESGPVARPADMPSDVTDQPPQA